MRRIILLAACLLALAGCSSGPGYIEAPTSSTPASSASQVHATGQAACKRAIKAQYVPGTARLKGEPTRPPECAGLSTDEVSQIALQVISENTK